MRAPSGRVLINTVDLYFAVSTQDLDGAPQFISPATPQQIGVPCSVQYTGTEELLDEQARVTVRNLYMVMFAEDPGLDPRDSMVWTDVSPPRILLVQAGPPSEAGRGRPFCVRAIEKI